jgi:hypothetical protein
MNLRTRIEEMIGTTVTDSVIDDITDVYDDDDAQEDFAPEYLDRLLIVVNAMRAGEFTIADVQGM